MEVLLLEDVSLKAHTNVHDLKLLLMNDCMYRSRSTARWVAFFDFDEFLWVQVERNSVNTKNQRKFVSKLFLAFWFPFPE